MNKANRNRGRRRSTGAAVVTVLFAVFLLGAIAAAFLTVAIPQTRESVGDIAQAQALYVAEAGVDRSIAEIQSGIDAGGDGLGRVAGTITGGSYEARATEKVIDGTAPRVEWRIESDASIEGGERRLEVVIGAEPTTPFAWGIFANERLRLKPGAFVDSYDSRNGTYASQRVNTDPTSGLSYANALGHVGSNGEIRLDPNAAVMGNATPGPGETVELKPGAYVSGSTEPMTEPIPLPLPPYEPVGPSLGKLDKTSGTLTLAAGTYHYEEFKIRGNATALVQGEVTLYVDAHCEVEGSGQIRILPGARLTLRHGSNNLYLRGGGVVNEDQEPTSFVVYSSTDNNFKIEIDWGSDFYGALYAPAAPIRFGEGVEAFGSVVGERVELENQAGFHYDEALADLDRTLTEPYRVRFWNRRGQDPAEG
jgi:hypothetical protein